MAIPRMKQLVAQNYPGTKVAITEFVIPASGLAPAVAHLPRAASTATASAPVPVARPGPADGFLRATRFDGRKVAGGWNPKAWDPPALRPAWARRQPR